MALIDQAKSYIEQSWDVGHKEDPMWELVVKQDCIRGVAVFFYAPRGVFELSGEAQFPYLIAGNAPLIYDQTSEKFMVTGTAHPVETYIQAYLRFGDPHDLPGSTVSVTGWEAGAQKINATKVIREYGGYGLAEAKACVDDVLEGNKVILTTSSPDIAEKLANELNLLGFVVEQNPISYQSET